MIDTDVAKAAEILRRGGLVAFPTETVYGLGGNALDPRAVARIFEVKARPAFDPLIVHVHNLSRLAELVTDIPAAAKRLAEQFWPGPLTLVLPKSAAVPDLVTSGLPTVAVRIPDHPIALQLLEAAAIPVAAPSANPFGRISPTTAQHVADQLGDRIEVILDGGPCRVGVESTVLDLSGDVPVLLRPGGVPVEELEAALRCAIAPAPAVSPSVASPSPGMLSRHYAPRTPLTIEPQPRRPGESERVGLLCFTPLSGSEHFAAVEVLSVSGDLTEAAAGFFAAMRRLDESQLDRIVATPFPEAGLGRALNDRLHRAAHSDSPP